LLPISLGQSCVKVNNNLMMMVIYHDNNKLEVNANSVAGANSEQVM
jgi:hypothetical protein